MSKDLQVRTRVYKELIPVKIDTVLDYSTEVGTELVVGIHKIGKVPSIKSFTFTGALRLNSHTIGIFDKTPIYAFPDQQIILLVNNKFLVKFYNDSGDLKTMRDLVSCLGDDSPVAKWEEAMSSSPKTITSEAYCLPSETHPELTDEDVLDLYGVSADLSKLF